MNDLEKYFYNNTNRKIAKYPHYFDIYERYFSKFRGLPINILEIGIAHGGSLQMWKDYFGPDAMIYGIDANDKTAIEESQIKTILGNQGDRNFLKTLSLPELHVLIDDGSHDSIHQRITFEELFPRLADNGVYFCEDLHTAYREGYHGGYKHKDSFIEYCKDLIDDLNGEASQINSPCAKLIQSIHFYVSAVVILKGPTGARDSIQTGLETT